MIFRYTEEEIKAFSSIMKLERGFRAIVSACSGDVRHILALINKVGPFIYLDLSLFILIVSSRFHPQHLDFGQMIQQS
jgi:hypothetical protein